ncbi:MAG: DUF1016 family protein [Elusimicrobia bacterium]|jgi:predicted nuclease of restriction endonuclease-like (RecB) superfamily|nr:DUF1016 family protein [Elusimicrobiota bacterium]
MSKKFISRAYHEALIEIKKRIRLAHYEALRTVNQELIRLYWDIGKTIVDSQSRHGWGKSVVESLAKDLQLDFPGVHGFSPQNLWYMRQFYAEYHKNPNLQPLVGEISWAKHLVVLAKCKTDIEREFYVRMTKKFGWTKNVLIHQIENQSYEKTLLNQTNFSKALPENIKKQAHLAVKDEYTFDFLQLAEEHSEMELERSLIAKVNRFLTEMGGAFAFMGNQYRLEIEGEEFFIDILLYHRRLQCLVAVELKVGKFQPEHVGKMQFYLAALDGLVKEKNENPSIGIILCKEKRRTIVEYALKESHKPIAVAHYRVTSTLPKELRKELPGPDQIRHLLGDLSS